jgi:hypothetical protein
MNKLPRIVAIVGGVSFVALGLYGFLAPQDFFDQLATFPPYNVHLIHDIGAFNIAIGTMLVLAATARDGLFAALAGATIGQGFHLASHVMDEELGENQSTMIPVIAAVTVILLVATVVRERQRT